MNCENTVTLSGTLHLPKGDMEGSNQHGQYLKFSVKQSMVGYDGIERTSFLPVRVFDPALKEWLKTRKEGDAIRLTGSIRSSSGSGDMFIRPDSLEAPCE
ncbi:MAG TPA: DNA-binding protein, partial [Synergistaceae bacterium]|nr:DNA-binding protein [Synergistaceae bacterium]